MLSVKYTYKFHTNYPTCISIESKALVRDMVKIETLKLGICLMNVYFKNGSKHMLSLDNPTTYTTALCFGMCI